MGCCPKGVYKPLVRDCNGEIISLPADGTFRVIVPVITVSAVTTIGPTNAIILADATDGAFSIFLPPAIEGGDFIFKKVDGGANIVTIDGDDGETIDGSTTHQLTLADNFVRIIADTSSNWWVVSD